jgi:dihydropteroate synthase
VAPTGIVSGPAAGATVAAGAGWPIAGGELVFTTCAVLLRDNATVTETYAPFDEVLDWAAAEGEEVASHVSRLIHRIGGRRSTFAGVKLDRPVIMGVVNVTPDSFSNAGDTFDATAAIARGKAMLEAGAAIIDVGGESTRPGADPVSPVEEVRRVLPVVAELARCGAVVSVDTRHASTMAAAIEAGATIVNDVTALTGDPAALYVAANARVSVVLMHMQGEPRAMQVNPVYDYPPLDIYDALAERVANCTAAGIPLERICVDPGIGFGKTVHHNLQTLARLGLYHGLGCPVLLGVSRKSFIAQVSGETEPKRRLPGSLAAAQIGLEQGVQLLRVHDVAETCQAVAVWRSVRGEAM